MVRHEQPMLFDVKDDPGQVHDLASEQRPAADGMRDLLVHALRELDAPAEQFRRLGLDKA